MSIGMILALYYLTCFALFIPAMLIARPTDVLQTACAFALAPLVVARWLARHWQSYFAAAALILLVALLSGCGEYEEAVADSVRYCEMVDLWKATNGRDGWQAWRGERECRELAESAK